MLLVWPICPGMLRQMLLVYKQYAGNPRVTLLSHTVDHDTLLVLRDYAGRLGITSARQWHFATAPHDTIFALAQQYILPSFPLSVRRNFFAEDSISPTPLTNVDFFIRLSRFANMKSLRPSPQVPRKCSTL
jgi:hypothetical protein